MHTPQGQAFLIKRVRASTNIFLIFLTYNTSYFQNNEVEELARKTKLTNESTMEVKATQRA